MGVVLDDSPGERVLLYGADGSVLRKVVVDSSGHLQVDTLTSALPSGAATEVTLAEANARLGDEVGPAAGTVNKQLADLLTELASVLDAAARLYGYDGAAWQALQVQNAATPNLRVGLFQAANQAGVVQSNADGGDATWYGLQAVARLYGFNGSTWDRLRTFDTGILQVAQSFTDAFTQAAEGSYAPHAKTARWTYTVPAGRRGIFDYVCCRADSTAALGDGVSGIDFTPSGGTARTLCLVESNTTDRRAAMVHVECHAEAGDVFTGWTFLAGATSRWLGVNAWFRELTL